MICRSWILAEKSVREKTEKLQILSYFKYVLVSPYHVFQHEKVANTEDKSPYILHSSFYTYLHVSWVTLFLPAGATRE